MVKINGISCERHKPLKIEDEIEWSNNKGTTASGVDVGSVLGYRRKLTIGFPFMTFYNVRILLTAIKSSPYFPVVYTDPDTQQERTEYFSLDGSVSNQPLNSAIGYSNEFEITLRAKERRTYA